MAVTRSRGRTVPTPKARYDAYIGLLLISLLALIAGTVLLYMELEVYVEQGKGGDPPPAPELFPATAQPSAPVGGADPGAGFPADPGGEPMQPPMQPDDPGAAPPEEMGLLPQDLSEKEQVSLPIPPVNDDPVPDLPPLDGVPSAPELIPVSVEDFSEQSR